LLRVAIKVLAWQNRMSQVAEALGTIPGKLVPDMPDRIIAATALHLGVPLVTCDRRLQSGGIRVIW